MNKIILIITLLIVFSCKNSEENSQGENFSKNVDQVGATIVNDSDKLQFFNNEIQPLDVAFQPFKVGSIKPKGWMLDMMQNDLNKGIVGALVDLYPGIKADDLYNTARRGGMEDIPEMGDLVLTGEAWEKSIMWWNAETIGNWWDGFVRHAFLTNNDKAIQQAHTIIINLLESQDKDGYIGIYKPNLRYQHNGSNGELWAQTTAFRTMLAYYEFTQKQEVLNAVERAMELTMKNYGKEGKNPFDLKDEFGGVTHGLMLTDVCETLYQITGNIKYQDYATYLYKAFSTFSINRSFNDLRYPFLTEKEAMFQGHGVHTYEHIRSMVNAYYNTGYPELKTAYLNMLHKLEACILPSGAGHGDEWILELPADPDKTATEYCTMLELRNSYGSLLQKTGQIKFADAAEKLTYNGMLGFRNKDGTAITYSKFDNCYVIDGQHHSHGETKPEPRYKYSPTHSEPAVCCVPNYGRNLTYFMNQMYMGSEDDIAIMMYGPSELTTEINSTTVSITQETNYPWTNTINFKIKANRAATFTLKLRKPQWSESLEFSNIDEVKLEGDFYVITKEWQPEGSFLVTFNNPIQKKTAGNNEVFIQKGPLVYALKIPHTEKAIRYYNKPNFKDYYCYPESETYKSLVLTENSEFATSDSENLQGNFYDTNKQTAIEATLVPMGKTVLRRVTFPKKSN